MLDLTGLGEFLTLLVGGALALAIIIAIPLWIWGMCAYLRDLFKPRP